MTLADARRVIAAAKKKANDMAQPMNIAVADEGAAKKFVIDPHGTARKAGA